MAIEAVYNEQKMRELILYIAQQCEPDPSFEAVKLNKDSVLLRLLSPWSHGATDYKCRVSEAAPRSGS